MDELFGEEIRDYARGWNDHVRSVRRRAPDHRAAMHGCAGTGEHRPHGFGWYAPGEDPEMWRTPRSCTADDAVIAGVRHD
jgi:hypothetical protein